MDLVYTICQILAILPNFVSPNERDMRFFLFKRPLVNSPIELNSTNQHELARAKKIIFFTHGLDSFAFEPLNILFKNKYLKRYDCNFILVDWPKISHQNYFLVMEKIPTLATQLATFLCEISKKLATSLSAIHLLGHSLGAQISGLAGQFTTQVCNEEIGRITGLDPAGPIFQKFPEDMRLSSDDAIFVEVVHTNALLAGYYGNCGDVDFYVNCGTQQPGCPENNIEGNWLKDALGCSHVRAIFYWMESLFSDNLIAQSCSGCPLMCIGDEQPEYIVMGEDCPRNSSKRVFWLPTNPKSPYGAGCSPYKDGCS